MLKENLKNEIAVLESMIQAFKGLETSVVSKDIEMVSKYAVNIEELGLELMKIESERDELLKAHQVNTVREYAEKYETPEKPEIMFLSTEIVEKLNELTIVMDGIRQIIEFDNQYVELLNNLVRGIQSPTYDFSKNKPSYSNSYTQIQNHPRYDGLK